jgi:sugar/nucleoside kinase (ribokinase family)
MPRSQASLLVLGPFLVDRVRRGRDVEPVDHPGGNGLVVACVAGRLGWPTALGAQLAPDRAGRWLRARALGAGVSLRAEPPTAGLETKRAEILVDAAGHWRTLSSRPRHYPYLPSPVGPGELEGCGAVLITGLCSLWRSCRGELAGWLALARMARLPVILGLNRMDVGDGAVVCGILGPHDSVFCNREELCRWLGVSGAGVAGLSMALQAAPGGDLVVSLGSEGVLVRPRGELPVHLPAEPVEVRSSVGAGDVLCAVTTVLRLAGVPLLDAVGLAQRAASRSVMGAGWERWIGDDPGLVSEIRGAISASGGRSSRG